MAHQNQKEKAIEAQTINRDKRVFIMGKRPAKMQHAAEGEGAEDQLNHAEDD